MLKFCRNKLVGIEFKAPDTLMARGVLEDDIYGLKLDVVYDLFDLRITSIQGKWNRWTTPECPRATPVSTGGGGALRAGAGFW